MKKLTLKQYVKHKVKAVFDECIESQPSKEELDKFFHYMEKLLISAHEQIKENKIVIGNE